MAVEHKSAATKNEIKSKFSKWLRVFLSRAFALTLQSKKSRDEVAARKEAIPCGLRPVQSNAGGNRGTNPDPSLASPKLRDRQRDVKKKNKVFSGSFNVSCHSYSVTWSSYSSIDLWRGIHLVFGEGLIE